MSEDDFVSIKPSFGRKVARESKAPNDSHVESKDAYNEKPPVRRKPQVVDPDATEESEVDFNTKKPGKNDKKDDKKKAKKDGGSEKPETPNTDESFFSQNKTIIVIIVFVIILVIVVIWIFVKDPKKNPFSKGTEENLGNPGPNPNDPRMIAPPNMRDPRMMNRNAIQGPPPSQGPPTQMPGPQNQGPPPSQGPDQNPPQNQAPRQMPPLQQANHQDLVQSSDADEEAIRYMQRKKMMHDEQKRRGKIEVIESDDEASEEAPKSKTAKKTKKTEPKTAPKKKGKAAAKTSKKSDEDINDEDLENLTMHSDDEATDVEGVDDLEELEFSEEETAPKKPVAKRGRKPAKGKK